MKNGRRLFLYGSWFPGQVHYRLIERFVESCRPAIIKGSVYRSSVGFPLYVQEGKDRVPGVIAEVGGPASLWSIVDQVQGEAKGKRIAAKAIVEDDSLDVLVYAVSRQELPKHFPRIAGGDWQRNLDLHPDLVSRLSAKQKVFLERLGASSGSKGAPDDLGIYRELLKLDLIVDRGRNVSLSELGHEVVRYLPTPVEVRH